MLHYPQLKKKNHYPEAAVLARKNSDPQLGWFAGDLIWEYREELTDRSV